MMDVISFDRFFVLITLCNIDMFEVPEAWGWPPGVGVIRRFLTSSRLEIIRCLIGCLINSMIDEAPFQPHQLLSPGFLSIY